MLRCGPTCPHGPKGFSPGKEAEQAFHAIIFCVGIEKDATFGRRLGKPTDHERICLSCWEVEFPNSPVDPALQTFFYIRKDCPIPGPGPPVLVGAIWAQ